jgi:riboflavin kinase/FMN adenylyltransferase
VKVLLDIKQLDTFNGPGQRSSSPPSPKAFGPITKSVVTIGNFDGVHLGHRELFGRLLEKAKFHSAPSVVMTFNPHPIQVLYPEKQFVQLFDRDDQIVELEKLGIDYLFIQPFSRLLSQMAPQDFLKEIIFRPLSPKTLIVGHDFSFGADRAGSIELLKDLSSKWNFELEVIPPYKIDGQIVSSSLIREKIKCGHVRDAQRLLGRPFSLSGVVMKGAKRGRTIGFPTANLAVQAGVVPSAGVYVSKTRIEESSYFSVTNIGLNPTFQDDRNLQEVKVKIETHIFDFSSDIYGQKINVSFFEKLRDEKKFASAQELKTQITKDVQNAKDYFKKVELKG